MPICLMSLNSGPILVPGPNETLALPDLSRIATQVAAKGCSRAGRNTGGVHVRSFAILLCRLSPRRSLDVTRISESLRCLVQFRSRGGYRARSRTRTRGLLAATRQVDGRRAALGLSFRWPPQMLVPGRRGDGDGEEA